ncbi:MAG: leucine-rich repeat domain-containing protein [Bacteroidetes bacterium]|nr:leucine-rich repeat domain-containing protein [Bacteroidota bacterium]
MNIFDFLKSLLLSCLIIALININVFAQYNTTINFNSASDTIKCLSAEDIESVTSTSTPPFKAIIDPNIETIDSNAFKTALRNNDILDSLIEVEGINVKKIGIGAFEDCGGLIKADFPNVDTLQINCFAICYSLKEINLGSVKHISHTAFAVCVGLEKIYLLGDDLPTLGEGVFNYGITSGQCELIVSQAIINKYGYNTALWPDTTWKLFYVYNENPILAWGPKIKLDFTNDVSDRIKLFIGVDTLATDGYDSGIVFRYKDSTLDTNLIEDIDLPPPFNNMTCRLVKDSNNATGSYSYVDFRGIPVETKFHHRYWINVRWHKADSATQIRKIKLNWGKLPEGIDSAKIRCREWWDTDLYINMHEAESLDLEDINDIVYNNLFIDIWFSKGVGITYNKDNNDLIFPNPTENYINLLDDDYTHYSIYNLVGEAQMSGKIEDNKINVVNLPSGTYILILNKNNNSPAVPFIKK